MVQVEITSEREKRIAAENENQALRAHVNDRNNHIEALKQTIYQQNQDLRVYKHNEVVLREKLSQKVTPIVVEKNYSTLPLYEPAIKPEPLDLTYKPAEVKDNKIIPSPVRVEHQVPMTQQEFNDRAGVKSKKDCTIDCVFSSKGCEQCSYSKAIRASYPFSS